MRNRDIHGRVVAPCSIDDEDDGIIVRGQERLVIIGGMAHEGKSNSVPPQNTSNHASRDGANGHTDGIHIDPRAVQLHRRSWIRDQLAHDAGRAPGLETRNKSSQTPHAHQVNITNISSRNVTSSAQSITNATHPNITDTMPLVASLKNNDSMTLSNKNASPPPVPRLDVGNLDACLHHDWVRTMTNEKFFDAMSQMSKSVAHAVDTGREQCISGIVATYCAHKNSTLYNYSQMMNTTPSCDAAHPPSRSWQKRPAFTMKVPHFNSRQLKAVPDKATIKTTTVAAKASLGNAMSKTGVVEATRRSKLVYVLAISSRGFVQQVKNIIRAILVGENDTPREGNTVALILIHVDKGTACLMCAIDYSRDA